MAVAGVIAAFGVIEFNSILIVGAMAVSPDILPITATCTGLVLRRRRLTGRALATLVVGLAVACVVAAGLTAALGVCGPPPRTGSRSARAGCRACRRSTSPP